MHDIPIDAKVTLAAFALAVFGMLAIMAKATT